MKSFFANHPILLVILRWILFIPGGLAAGVVSAYLWRFLLSTGYAGSAGEVFYELGLTNGFAGNLIWGPILVVSEMVITAFVGMFTALYLAPKSRAVVGGILIGMMLMMAAFAFIMQGSQFEYLFPWEARIRFCLEWLGVLAGCILGIVAISNWMRDYAKDGVYDLNQAVDSSWNELFQGKITEEITEREINQQNEFIRKTDFYKTLSKASKEITSIQLCSVNWQRRTKFFQFIKLCHILEIEMIDEFLSWTFEQRSSLKHGLLETEDAALKELYKKFAHGKKTPKIKLTLGNCIYILKELGHYFSENKYTANDSPFSDLYCDDFIDWVLNRDCHREAQKIIRTRNNLVHSAHEQEPSLTILVGVENIWKLDEENHEHTGFLIKFLNRKKL